MDINQQQYIVLIYQNMAEQIKNQSLQLPLTINRQSQFYINIPFKLHSLKLRLRNRIMKSTKQMYSQCSSCATDQCLNDVERKLVLFKAIKGELEEKMKKLQDKFEQDYYLCRDLVFQNDIRVCRVDVMNKYYQDFVAFVNQSRITQI